MTDGEKKQPLSEIEKAELEEELQMALEKFPEEFEEVFGLKQPFDSNTRPYDIVEYKGGQWGVVLSVGPDDKIATVGPFATKEDALAFVAGHSPRNG
jgi:hypothetical protein